MSWGRGAENAGPENEGPYTSAVGRKTWLPDTSAAIKRHFGSIAEVSLRYIGSAAEVSVHLKHYTIFACNFN